MYKGNKNIDNSSIAMQIIKFLIVKPENEIEGVATISVSTKKLLTATEQKRILSTKKGEKEFQNTNDDPY